MDFNRIYIITNDTLQTLGINHILKKYFNVAKTIICTKIPIDISDRNNSFFIISNQIYNTNPSVFNSNNTVIINDCEIKKIQTINAQQSESEIVKKLSLIFDFTKLSQTNSYTIELSQREIDVLKLIAKGYINKEIAISLSISINTVLSHRKNISAKLGIKSASGLGIYAIMNGLISEEELNNTLIKK